MTRASRFIAVLLVAMMVTLLVGVVLLAMAVKQQDRYNQQQAASTEYALTLTSLQGLFSHSSNTAKVSHSDRLAILIARADMRVGNSTVNKGLWNAGGMALAIETAVTKSIDNWRRIRRILADMNREEAETGDRQKPSGLLRNDRLRFLAEANRSFDQLFVAITADTLSVPLLRTVSEIGASLKNLGFLLNAGEVAGQRELTGLQLEELSVAVKKLQALTRNGGGSLLLGYRTNQLLGSFIESADQFYNGSMNSVDRLPIDAASDESHLAISGAIESALLDSRNFRRLLAAAADQNRRFLLTALVCVCTALLLSVLSAWWVKRRWQYKAGGRENHSLNDLAIQINALADGNLEASISGSSDMLSQSIARAVDYTRSMMRSLVLVSRGVARKTTVNVERQQLVIEHLVHVERSRRQQVTLLTRQLSNCIDSIEHTGDYSTSTKQNFTELKKVVSESQRSVSENASSLAEASAQLDLGRSRLSRVTSTTGELSGLASSMKQVAESTNLLALNTSIQMSAYADDSVLDDNARFVDEVTQIARLLTGHADDTGKLLVSVGQDIESVVELLENNVDLLAKSAQRSTITSQVLSGLSETADTMIQNSSESLALLETDRAHTQDVLEALRGIDELSLDGGSSTEELLQISSELKAMASKLDRSVSQYQLDEDTASD